MLRNESIQGYWFLPGATETAHVPGVLTISHSGLELSLNGILDERDPLGSHHRVIFGVTSRGKDVTLAGCFTTHGTLSFPGYPVTRYHVGTALLGAHLNVGVDTPCSAFKVRFGSLPEFVGGRPFELARDGDIVHVKGFLHRSLRAELDGCNVSVESELSPSIDDWTRIELRQNRTCFSHVTHRFP